MANDGENHDGGEENEDDAQPDNVEQNENEDEAVTRLTVVQQEKSHIKIPLPR